MHTLPSLNRPQRIIRTCCLLGLIPVVGLQLFVELHPLNTKPSTLMEVALRLAITAFPFGVLYASALLARERRALSWLLLVPTLLVLLVMSWGCFGDMMLADSAIRAEAAGQRYMNCAGSGLFFAIPLSFLISLAALTISAASFGVNRWLLRSPRPSSRVA